MHLIFSWLRFSYYFFAVISVTYSLWMSAEDNPIWLASAVIWGVFPLVQVIRRYRNIGLNDSRERFSLFVSMLALCFLLLSTGQVHSMYLGIAGLLMFLIRVNVLSAIPRGFREPDFQPENLQLAAKRSHSAAFSSQSMKSPKLTDSPSSAERGRVVILMFSDVDTTSRMAFRELKEILNGSLAWLSDTADVDVVFPDNVPEWAHYEGLQVLSIEADEAEPCGVWLRGGASPIAENALRPSLLVFDSNETLRFSHQSDSIRSSIHLESFSAKLRKALM